MLIRCCCWGRACVRASSHVCVCVCERALAEVCACHPSTSLSVRRAKRLPSFCGPHFCRMVRSERRRGRTAKIRPHFDFACETDAFVLECGARARARVRGMSVYFWDKVDLLIFGTGSAPAEPLSPAHSHTHLPMHDDSVMRRSHIHTHARVRTLVRIVGGTHMGGTRALILICSNCK